MPLSRSRKTTKRIEVPRTGRCYRCGFTGDTTGPCAIKGEVDGEPCWIENIYVCDFCALIGSHGRRPPWRPGFAYPCPGCSRWFEPSRIQWERPIGHVIGDRAGVWCSVDCRRRWENVNQSQMAALRRAQTACLKCGGRVGFDVRVKKSGVLCGSCRAEKLTPKWDLCPCGAERWSNLSPYCESCAELARRDINRRKNTKRRGKRSSTYTLKEIAMRDGFRCHICRRRVDMEKSGRAKWGPTIDHLIPLSEGGQDVPENVRLAHRKCNVDRNTGGSVQLLLMG